MEGSEEPPALPCGGAAALLAPGGGYLRVLDDEALVGWAEEHDAVLRLRVRPGGFVFPGSPIGEVTPAARRAAAQAALEGAMSLGDARSIEQDLEFAVRQLVEIGLRALSPGINDPFTAIAVLDRLGAALCELAGRELPPGQLRRNGRLRLCRTSIDYAGLVDAMFHMLRQAGSGVPAVIIRLLEILAEAGTVERNPERRGSLLRHADFVRDAALGGTQDPAAREAIMQRHERAHAIMGVSKAASAIS